MRGLQVRSADTLDIWSVALIGNMAVGGIRAYVDAQSLGNMPLTGGTFTGPVIMAGDGMAPLAPATVRQVSASITAAINTLVGASPAALDTVYELAAALNNDPDIIGNLTTLVGQKASLAGATFTGPVVVPSNTSQTNAVVTLGNVQTLIAAIPLMDYTFSAQFETQVVGAVTTVSLAPVGAAGTYSRVTTDAYGRVTAGANLLVADLPLLSPASGAVFPGTPISVTSALNQVQAAIDGLTQDTSTADGFEDTWTGTGVQVTFPFTNVNGPMALLRPHRVLVFIDGSRQARNSYTLSNTGITFTAAPTVGLDVEVVQIA